MVPIFSNGTTVPRYHERLSRVLGGRGEDQVSCGRGTCSGGDGNAGLGHPGAGLEWDAGACNNRGPWNSRNAQYRGEAHDHAYYDEALSEVPRDNRRRQDH